MYFIHITNRNKSDDRQTIPPFAFMLYIHTNISSFVVYIVARLVRLVRCFACMSHVLFRSICVFVLVDWLAGWFLSRLSQTNGKQMRDHLSIRTRVAFRTETRRTSMLAQCSRAHKRMDEIRIRAITYTAASQQHAHVHKHTHKHT